MRNNPLTINQGANSGMDLLWSGPVESFDSKEISVANLLSYSFLLVVTINNKYDKYATQTLISTKSLSDGHAFYLHTLPEYTRQVKIFVEDRISISYCGPKESIYYKLNILTGEYELTTEPTTGNVGEYVTVNTTTDSVIPIRIYGIR